MHIYSPLGQISEPVLAHQPITLSPTLDWKLRKMKVWPAVGCSSVFSSGFTITTILFGSRAEQKEPIVKWETPPRRPVQCLSAATKQAVDSSPRFHWHAAGRRRLVCLLSVAAPLSHSMALSSAVINGRAHVYACTWVRACVIISPD